MEEPPAAKRARRDEVAPACASDSDSDSEVAQPMDVIQSGASCHPTRTRTNLELHLARSSARG